MMNRHIVFLCLTVIPPRGAKRPYYDASHLIAAAEGGIPASLLTHLQDASGREAAGRSTNFGFTEAIRFTCLRQVVLTDSLDGAFGREAADCLTGSLRETPPAPKAPVTASQSLSLGGFAASYNAVKSDSLCETFGYGLRNCFCETEGFRVSGLRNSSVKIQGVWGVWETAPSRSGRFAAGNYEMSESFGAEGADVTELVNELSMVGNPDESVRRLRRRLIQSWLNVLGRLSEEFVGLPYSVGVTGFGLFGAAEGGDNHCVINDKLEGSSFGAEGAEAAESLRRRSRRSIQQRVSGNRSCLVRRLRRRSEQRLDEFGRLNRFSGKSVNDLVGGEEFVGGEGSGKWVNDLVGETLCGVLWRKVVLAAEGGDATGYGRRLRRRSLSVTQQARQCSKQDEHPVASPKPKSLSAPKGRSITNRALKAPKKEAAAPLKGNPEGQNFRNYIRALRIELTATRVNSIRSVVAVVGEASVAKRKIRALRQGLTPTG